MQSRIFYQLLFCVVFLGVLCACNKMQPNDIKTNNTIIALKQPSYNPQTEQGIALGRKLFYDPILSVNNSISCASCHIQALAFSDGKTLRTSELSGHKLSRHSPTLTNVGYIDQLFWDGGIPNLEFLAPSPITNPDEMGENLILLCKKLNKHNNYPALFSAAFHKDSIEFSDIANALSQFLRSLQSFNSKYDAWKRGQTELSDLERNGYTFYIQKCSSCHTEGLFTDNNFHNNGLDDDFSNDTLLGILQGRFRISLDAKDLGSFKTPTLRNLGFSAPYMHDGRFAELVDVLEHYSTGIKNSQSLDPILRDLPEEKIQLSKAEKMALLAFLQTLNDFDFVRNEAFSKPD